MCVIWGLVNSKKQAEGTTDFGHIFKLCHLSISASYYHVPNAPNFGMIPYPHWWSRPVLQNAPMYDPKLEVPTIYKAYVRGIYPKNMAWYGTVPPF